jgi:hypothetical protein
MLARDKHSSLLQKFVNYGQKGFITLGPVHPSVCSSIYLPPVSDCMFVRPSVFLSVHPSVRPSVRLSVRLSVHELAHPTIPQPLISLSICISHPTHIFIYFLSLTLQSPLIFSSAISSSFSLFFFS